MTVSLRLMKESGIDWIGAIPSEWRMGRIGGLYKHRNVKVNDVDYPPLSVTMRGILPQLATAAKSDDHDNRKLVRKGDFAINSRSDRRGSCGISEYEGSVSLINTVLEPRSQMSPRYYGFLFRTSEFADEFYKWGHGIVDDLWTTRWADMKAMKVPVPALEEQERIADFLDEECGKIDSVKQTLAEEIEALKRLRKATIHQAVTKGLDPTAPMKPSGVEWIGDVPQSWEKCKVWHVCSVIGSGTTPASHAFSYYDTGDVHWIQSGDIYGKEVLSDTEKKVTREAVTSVPALKVYRAPYLVMAMYGGSVGNLATSTIDACTNQACCVIKNNEQVSLRFLYYWLTFCKVDLLSQAEGGGQPNISQSKIKRQVLLLPVLAEQQAIVDYLDERCAAIDSIIDTRTKQLERLEDYRKALIFAYVTGKKQVA